MSLMKRLQSFFWMTITYTVILVALFCGGSYALFKYMNREVELQNKIEKLDGQVKDLTAKNEKLTLANRLLKVDTRRAKIEVLQQEESDGTEKIKTTLRFTEYDDNGKEVGPYRDFTILGDTLHLEAYVAKFNDEFVETNDPQRSHSLCAFRRIYGEFQKPADGFMIDAQMNIPVAYQEKDRPESDIEKQLWRRFWEISNDPLLQQSLGLRANHGESVIQRLIPGKIYLVELRASGGLSIRPAWTE